MNRSVVLSALALATAAPPSGAQETLKPAAEFASIADARARSAALIREAGKVLLHARCTNCHPSGDRPLQNEDGRLHEPPVVRGPGGLGVDGMHCPACHQDENFDPGRVPGAPHWALAPSSMAWQGRSLGDVCRQIRDPARNGDRTLEQIADHMREDALVGWAWTPGADRQPAPGTQEAFGALIAAWIETGAVCPD